MAIEDHVLPSVAPPSPHLNGSRDQRRVSTTSMMVPHISREKQRTYARLLASLCVLAVLWYIIHGSYQGLAVRRARDAARNKRQLGYFSGSRLDNIPEAIKQGVLGEQALLSHPLLAQARSPNCRLNVYQEDRYAPLEPAYGSGPRNARPHYQPRHDHKYLVALNLFDSAGVLPSLIRVLHTVLVALGPKRFHVSIYENGSKDDTPAQLYLLAQLLDRIGTGHTIISDPLRVSGAPPQKRIPNLAELRNLALKPLYDAPAGTYDRVLFINDVHFCEADLYEIMLQHEVQEADMSCGMDYKELQIPEFAGHYPLLFYDTWVARDMQGMPFYNIKWPSGDWELPSPVMPLSDSRARFDNLQPVQVFSCWNGVTILDAGLFTSSRALRFRAHEDGDAYSECYLLCSDIWKRNSPLALDGSVQEGMRGARIQVVPRTSVGYEVHEYEKARKDRNTTAFEVDGEQQRRALDAETVEWRKWPPKLVQNYPYGYWSHQQMDPPF